jgi:hypothetical protein
MFLEQIHDLSRGIRTRLERAFQEMRQEPSSALKLRMNRLGRLSCKGNPHGTKQLPCLSSELAGWRVQKLGILTWCNAAQQKRLDVHRPVPRRPFEPSQPPRDMLGRGHLPASIAPQTIGIRRNHPL